MPDYLRDLPVARVERWYRRLADHFGAVPIHGQVPMASMFLRTYLDNRTPNRTYFFEPRPYLQTSSYVFEVLQFHRRVFLTEEQARFDRGRRAWAGIVPRLRDGRWRLGTRLSLNYQSLVEVGSGLWDINRIQRRGSSEERDLFTSLRGFQLRSDVVVSGQQQNSSNIRITFNHWSCRVFDRYDWNFDEHLTVPNPDYGSTSSDAVRPQDRELIVYHRNAERLEHAGLAAPYNAESRPWIVIDPRITGPATVSP